MEVIIEKEITGRITAGKEEIIWVINQLQFSERIITNYDKRLRIKWLSISKEAIEKDVIHPITASMDEMMWLSDQLHYLKEGIDYDKETQRKWLNILTEAYEIGKDL